MRKNLLALAGALSFLLAGCNSANNPTTGNSTNVQGMSLGSQATPGTTGMFQEHEAFKHVVVVIEENHSYNEVVGDPNMPYLNNTLIPQGALMTDSHGTTHPSEPNYLALFDGSFFGIQDDNCSNTVPANSPNLAQALMERGKTFAIYSEDLPAQGSTTCTYTPPALLASTGDPAAGYRMKHNPYVFFQIEGTLPPEGNKTFAQFPQGDFDDLPTVSFVVPDQWHDEHDGTDVLCDQWLQQNMSAYNEWAKTHNSIMITTWDENDFVAASNQIATVITGAEVIPGQYSQTINHYNVLRTIEDFYHAAPSNNAASAAPITGIFH